MLGNKPNIQKPEGIEKKKMMINILKRRLLNDISKNIGGESWQDIQEKLHSLFEQTPENLLVGLELLIEEDFGGMKIPRRLEIIQNLMTIFVLSCQEISLDTFEISDKLSPGEEVTKVEKSVVEILGISK